MILVVCEMLPTLKDLREVEIVFEVFYVFPSILVEPLHNPPKFFS